MIDIPEGYRCEAPEGHCACAQTPWRLTKCNRIVPVLKDKQFMRRNPVTSEMIPEVSELVLKHAERITGMTPEQAFSPNEFLREVPFEEMVPPPIVPVDTGPMTAALPPVPPCDGKNAAEMSPGEPVTQAAISAKELQAREDAGVADDNLGNRLTAFYGACGDLRKDPRNSKLRRLQRNAFAELLQAQYVFEEALSRVPPKKS